jgi:hypothetical protein
VGFQASADCPEPQASVSAACSAAHLAFSDSPISAFAAINTQERAGGKRRCGTSICFLRRVSSWSLGQWTKR